MKRWFAILFSLVLILSQAAFVFGSEGFGQQKANLPACCGHCKARVCCCANKNDSSARQPAPAVPPHNLSQTDWQILTAVTIQFSSQEPIEPAAISSPLFFQSAAAPLYQRNCSYII